MSDDIKIGDIVMFDNRDSTYTRWFFGKVGRVMNTAHSSTTGRLHVKVKWSAPVKYHDSHTGVSSFEASDFMLMGRKEWK